MRFLLRRFAQLLVVLLGVSVVVFGLVRLTGDPVVILLGEAATAEAVAEMRAELGLDRPIYVQYARFLGRALRGDFGLSLRYRQSALSLFVERLPATLELTAAALLLALAIGLPVGVVAALRPNSGFDGLVRGSALVGQAIPGFYLGLVAIIVFGAHLKLLPTGGRGTLAQLILPAATLAAYQIAVVARFARGAMLEVLGEDFVRTARAKGLTRARVVAGHALRNALIPVVTIVALQFGTLLSGAVVTETVFSWPGVGRLAVQAIYTRDFPVVQVTVMVTAVLFVVINLLADVVYVIVDPRIRVAD
ncbi:MAG: ABC transporter permease [Armatimonadota bacterium]|nr:ABC transporter permease [Armatimonadota bacterium]MDR7422565.1 ABC transporter permease [Armatimonadota bacterium]MDR7453938.1 ABC transporter permease [Armatimonadota bacterium]MDR7495748.1 ABC transporter permease [Armatimonadota bacterium]MDR7511043.1 ABC transporter permease [Armatimonadota bacterium]